MKKKKKKIIYIILIYIKEQNNDVVIFNEELIDKKEKFRIFRKIRSFEFNNTIDFYLDDKIEYSLMNKRYTKNKIKLIILMITNNLIQQNNLTYSIINDKDCKIEKKKLYYDITSSEVIPIMKMER